MRVIDVALSLCMLAYVCVFCVIKQTHVIAGYDTVLVQYKWRTNVSNT